MLEKIKDFASTTIGKFTLGIVALIFGFFVGTKKGRKIVGLTKVVKVRKKRRRYNKEFYAEHGYGKSRGRFYRQPRKRQRRKGYNNGY